MQKYWLQLTSSSDRFILKRQLFKEANMGQFTYHISKQMIWIFVIPIRNQFSKLISLLNHTSRMHATSLCYISIITIKQTVFRYNFFFVMKEKFHIHKSISPHTLCICIEIENEVMDNKLINKEKL